MPLTAYRFGSPGHDLIATSLHGIAATFLLRKRFALPNGRSAERRPIDELGIAVNATFP